MVVTVDNNSVNVDDTIKVTYTLKRLNKVTDFTQIFPAGMNGAAQVLAETTCPVAVFPTAATGSVGSNVRVLFNRVPDTDCNVVVGVKATKPGSFDLATGFSSTTLGTRIVGSAAGNYIYTATGDTVIVHDQTKPTVTVSVEKTSNPDDGQVTSTVLGEGNQVLTYTITGRAFGTPNDISLTHTLAGLELVTPIDAANSILSDTCHTPAIPGSSEPPVPPVAQVGSSATATSNDDPTSDVVKIAGGFLSGSDTSTAPSCEIKVQVAPSKTGPVDYAAGLVVDAVDPKATPLVASLINHVTPQTVYVADPRIPTVTLSLDKSRITLGDDAILTYRATGMPYGLTQTDFSFADSSLSAMAQTYFGSQSVVSNTCGGVAQPFGVTGGTLKEVTTAAAPTCELKVKWKALGAGHFNFGTTMILLNIKNGLVNNAGNPIVGLDVNPKLTAQLVSTTRHNPDWYDGDLTKVVKGDNVRVKYTVEGGNVSPISNNWSFNQSFVSAFDSVSYVSDSCGVTTNPADPNAMTTLGGVIGANSGMSGMTKDLKPRLRVVHNNSVTSCDFVVDVHSATPGHFDIGAGITSADLDGVDTVTSLVKKTDIFIADDTSPAITLSASKTTANLGDDVDVTFDVKGAAYGTPHTGLDFWLNDVRLDRGMATSTTLVSNTCNGSFLSGSSPEIYPASILGTETATPVACKAVMRLHMGGASVIDLVEAFRNDGDITLANVAPLKVTVRPTFTVKTDKASYKVGDLVNISYTVNGGTFASIAPLTTPVLSADGAFGYTQTLPGGLANPVKVSQGCPAPTVLTATSANESNNFSRWSAERGAILCTFVVRATATKPGSFDALAGIVSNNLNNQVAPSTIYVADTTKPTVALTASSANITTGDDVTLNYTVTGVPYGAVNPLTVTHALPVGIGTLSVASNTCGGTIGMTGATAALTGASLAGSETTAVPSCAFSLKLKTAKAGSYDFATGLTTSGTNGAKATPAQIADPAGFVAIIPVRALDTRNGAKVAAGSVTELQITGANGIPAEATDVVLNVTIVDPATAGFVTVYPCGEARPNTSNVNFEAGQTRSNGVTVKLGATGKVCVYTSTGANIIVDVNGAQVLHKGDGFAAFYPSRILDTRNRGSKLAAGEEYHLVVLGGQVPADASAVVLNITSTGAQDAGFLTVFPCGSTRPVASSLNFTAGSDIANSVVAKVGTNGDVCIVASAPTHVIADVNGAFSPSGANRSWQFVPSRVLDTRSTAKVAAGSVTEVAVRGVNGVPVNATAVVLNVTAVDSAAAGFLTVFPCGATQPNVSNLNYGAGQTVANAATVAVGTSGKVCVYSTSAAHLIVDLNGSYAPR